MPIFGKKQYDVAKAEEKAGLEKTHIPGASNVTTTPPLNPFKDELDQVARNIHKVGNIFVRLFKHKKLAPIHSFVFNTEKYILASTQSGIVVQKEGDYASRDVAHRKKTGIFISGEINETEEPSVLFNGKELINQTLETLRALKTSTTNTSPQSRRKGIVFSTEEITQGSTASALDNQDLPEVLQNLRYVKDVLHTALQKTYPEQLYHSAAQYQFYINQANQSEHLIQQVQENLVGQGRKIKELYETLRHTFRDAEDLIVGVSGPGFRSYINQKFIELGKQNLFTHENISLLAGLDLFESLEKTQILPEEIKTLLKTPIYQTTNIYTKTESVLWYGKIITTFVKFISPISLRNPINIWSANNPEVIPPIGNNLPIDEEEIQIRLNMYRAFNEQLLSYSYSIHTKETIEDILLKEHFFLEELEKYQERFHNIKSLCQHGLNDSNRKNRLANLETITAEQILRNKYLLTGQFGHDLLDEAHLEYNLNEKVFFDLLDSVISQLRKNKLDPLFGITAQYLFGRLKLLEHVLFERNDNRDSKYFKTLLKMPIFS